VILVSTFCSTLVKSWLLPDRPSVLGRRATICQRPFPDIITLEQQADGRDDKRDAGKNTSYVEKIPSFRKHLNSSSKLSLKR
jgi:hypothetical protein